MSGERKKILNMLAEGKISVSEADELLKAVSAEMPSHAEDGIANPTKSPKYLRIQVESKGEEDRPETVNIRVPFQLLRSGIKLASLVPAGVQGKVNSALKEKGVDIDLSKLKPENLESLVNDLADISIDVDNNNEKVRIFCE